MKQNRKCIVTLLIGNDYQKRWKQFYSKTWQAYAEIHGYDIKLIDDFIDPSEKSKHRGPHWQKLLILEQPDIQQYDYVVWLDSDVLINFHHAPCVVESYLNNKDDGIGVVSMKETNKLHERKDNREKRFYDFIETHGEKKRKGVSKISDIYTRAGLVDVLIDDYFNAGMMVLRPNSHAIWLREVYDNYNETIFSAYENYPLCYHLFKSNMVTFIDRRFNYIWPHEVMEHYPFILSLETYDNKPRYADQLVKACINVAWHNSFFFHLINDKGLEYQVNHIDTEISNVFNILSNSE